MPLKQSVVPLDSSTSICTAMLLLSRFIRAPETPGRKLRPRAIKHMASNTAVLPLPLPPCKRFNFAEGQTEKDFKFRKLVSFILEITNCEQAYLKPHGHNDV